MTTECPDEEAIFVEAIEKQSAEERAAYLEAACGADADLRRSVEELLKAHSKSTAHLDVPALGSGANPRAVREISGTLIGRYKLLEMIGEGGFGDVWMAEQQEPVHRKVALKIIKHGMDTRQVIARFEAERQALALMDHLNIAKALDAGATATGRPYFVMDLVRGVPITDYCDQNRVNTQDRLRLFIDVCSAIEHAHQKGIIHRDIKPNNVMVALHDSKPVPKVIDFGIAKATQQRLTERTLYTSYQQLVGTPEYMSPEQAAFSDLDVDTRSDIYSLGVMLYELLVGTTPFDRKQLRNHSYEEICRVIRESDPLTPSRRLSTSAMVDTVDTVAKHRQSTPTELGKLICGDLDWIVMKALEKDRRRRYETASSLAQDIERYLSYEPVLARPPSTTYRVKKFVHKYRGQVAAAGAVLGTLILGFVVAVIGFARAHHQKETAVAEQTRANRLSEELRLRSQQLENQLRTATVTRLATQSMSLHDQWPVRSLLLAIEAVEMTRQHDGSIMPVAHEALLNSAPLVAGVPLVGHDDEILSMAISPNGQWLFTGSKDASVRIWNLDAENPGASPRVLRGHEAGIPALAITPDGRWLVTGSSDTTVRMWDLNADNPSASVRILQGHEKRIRSLAISSDGQWLATGAYDHTARLWDLTAEDPSASSRVMKGHEQCSYDVAFSPDGRWLLTTPLWEGRRPLLWDLHAKDPTAAPLALEGNEGRVWSTAIGPDSHWLVTVDKRGNTFFWDLTANNPAATFRKMPRYAGVASMSISPNGRWLVTGGTAPQLWDFTADNPGNTASKLPGHTHVVRSTAISADSR